MAELLIPRVGGNSPLTMNSREIAELTGKEHKNVLADVRTMLSQLEMSSADFSAQYQDSTGRTLPCFALPKDLTITLVAGYSAPLRHRIVTRWLELEAANLPEQPRVPQTLPEALRLAADLAEQVAKTEAALAIAAPKAEALDTIATAGGSVCITDAAKNLHVRPMVLFSWLSAHGWIYRRTPGAPWMAYQDRVDQGLLTCKVKAVERHDGTQKLVERVHVTPKGLAKLAELNAAHNFKLQA